MKRLLCLCAALLAFVTSSFSQTKTDTIRLEVKPTDNRATVSYKFGDNVLPHVELEWVLGEGSITGKVRPADSGRSSFQYPVEDTGWIYIYYTHEQQEMYQFDIGSSYYLTDSSIYVGVSNCIFSLDVSGCTALERLACLDCPLMSLDVSSCPKLRTLNCSARITYEGAEGILKNLNIGNSSSLTTINCRGNQLTSLDVSGCPALTSLDCIYNQLTSLDVSGCSALTSLDCIYNQLTSLDVSGCSALTSLDCSYNQLTSLDVSGCSALTSLDCRDNQLTSLDVSGCSALTSLNCYDNRIPLSNLYENYISIPKWKTFNAKAQSDSIMILIDQPFDLSTERIIGQAISTYQLTDAYGRELDADFWTENKFEFCFHEPLKYTLKLQNINVGAYAEWSGLVPDTFTWHISVMEEMPVQYYTVKVASNNSAWGTVSLTGNGRYKEGSNVTITANAKEGYRFVNWTKKDGVVFSTEAVYTFTATENLDLTANFEQWPNVGNENPETDNFSVYSRNRTLYLSESRGQVQVYNVAGQCVYNGQATVIPVQQGGVYIVRVGERVFKVIVI